MRDDLTAGGLRQSLIVAVDGGIAQPRDDVGAIRHNAVRAVFCRRRALDHDVGRATATIDREKPDTARAPDDTVADRDGICAGRIRPSMLTPVTAFRTVTLSSSASTLLLLPGLIRIALPPAGDASERIKVVLLTVSGDELVGWKSIPWPSGLPPPP